MLPWLGLVDLGVQPLRVIMQVDEAGDNRLPLHNDDLGPARHLHLASRPYR
jgi:hypothetical protein